MELTNWGNIGRSLDVLEYLNEIKLSLKIKKSERSQKLLNLWKNLNALMFIRRKNKKKVLREIKNSKRLQRG